jgi:hypothetical protein
MATEALRQLAPVLGRACSRDVHFIVRCRAIGPDGEAATSVQVYSDRGEPLLAGRIALASGSHAGRILQEIRVLKSLREQSTLHLGHRCPDVAEVDFRGYVSSWQTWIPGTRLDVLLQNGASLEEVGGSATVALDIAYGNHSVDPYTPYRGAIEDAQEMLRHDDPDLEPAVSVLRQQWPSLMESAAEMNRETGQHGDLWPGNVLVSGNDVAVIDWEAYDTFLSPGFDLFHFVMGLVTEAGGLDFGVAKPKEGSQSLAEEIGILKSMLDDACRDGRIVHRLLTQYAPLSGIRKCQWNRALALYFLTMAYAQYAHHGKGPLTSRAQTNLHLAAAVIGGTISLG